MKLRVKTPSRLLLTVAFAISAMLLGIIGAVAAGTGTVTPPPKIAFVTTNANVAPDALTVGPMAGRLGAPLFITNKDNLGESTKDALVAYGADLIIVAGGPNTVTDGVLAQIAAATGKVIKDAATKPSDGIIRVFGDGRDETAVALSELIANYNPKFLPTDATAADSDLLDGKDSTEFLGKTEKAADADKLDGVDSGGFVSSDFAEATPLTYGGANVDITSATDTTVVSAAISLDDPCGGGTTSHRLLIMAGGTVQWLAGGVTGEGRLGLTVDTTALSFNGSTRVFTLDDDTEDDLEYQSVQSHYVATGLAAGNHTIRLMGDGFNGSPDFRVRNANMVVIPMGWTCS